MRPVKKDLGVAKSRLCCQIAALLTEPAGKASQPEGPKEEIPSLSCQTDTSPAPPPVTDDAVNGIVVDNIIRIIEERGFKKKAVAERAGISPQTFSSLLCRRTSLRAAHIPRIAEALGVDIADLYRFPDQGDQADR